MTTSRSRTGISFRPLLKPVLSDVRVVVDLLQSKKIEIFGVSELNEKDEESKLDMFFEIHKILQNSSHYSEYVRLTQGKGLFEIAKKHTKYWDRNKSIDAQYK